MQMAVRAVAKAADAFSSMGKTTCPVFRPTGAMTYDEPHLLSFKDCHRVSILAVGSVARLLIPYVFGEYQAANLARIRGQADLVYRDDMFFLYCTIEFQEPPPVEIKKWLGIDMGIINIAVDSDGTVHTGEKVEKVRRRFSKTRKNLQRRGTKSAKRILKRIRRREARFRAAENHRISKSLVANAKDTSRGLAVEDLSGNSHSFCGWASATGLNTPVGPFSSCASSNTRRKPPAGIPVVLVDPRNTSRTCSECGHCEKGNRKTQGSFLCRHCGILRNADEKQRQVSTRRPGRW